MKNGRERSAKKGVDDQRKAGREVVGPFGRREEGKEMGEAGDMYDQRQISTEGRAKSKAEKRKKLPRERRRRNKMNHSAPVQLPSSVEISLEPSNDELLGLSGVGRGGEDVCSVEGDFGRLGSDSEDGDGFEESRDGVVSWRGEGEERIRDESSRGGGKVGEKKEEKTHQ